MRSNTFISAPEHSGWLWKKRNSWLTKTSFSPRAKQWRRCWVVLRGFDLTYIPESASLPSSPMKESPSVPVGQVDKKQRVTLNRNTTMIEDFETDFDEKDSSLLGFYLRVNGKMSSFPPSWKLRADSEEEKLQWVIKLSQTIAIAKYFDEFEKVGIIGEGGQGKVYKLRNKISNELFAMKELEITDESKMNLAVSEAQILKDVMVKIGHPNIMEIKKVYHIGSQFYLLFPLCEGGELIQRIRQQKHFSEPQAAIILNELISALHAMHCNGFLHLDIKPENILFENSSKNSKIKITDFGLSRVYKDSSCYDFVQQEIRKCPPTIEEMKVMVEKFMVHGLGQVGEGVCGTIGFMSPELILAGYRSSAADVFAAGVVFYVMLCGYAPFDAHSHQQIIVKTLYGDYQKYGSDWDEVSEVAKDLLYSMLEVDPAKRITTDRILSHPFLSPQPHPSSLNNHEY